MKEFFYNFEVAKVFLTMTKTKTKITVNKVKRQIHITDRELTFLNYKEL